MIVISAFPGTGKTHCFNRSITGPEKHKAFKCVDSDSSKFDRADFPANYIDYIRKYIAHPKWTDVMFVSSHMATRAFLTEANVPYILVRPDINNKQEYMRRYRERDSTQAFIDRLDTSWDEWHDDMDNDHHATAVVTLGPGKYVSDILDMFYSPPVSAGGMAREQIKDIVIRLPHETYGRVNLPYDLHTNGIDRAPTRDIIFPASLEGKTVLDVGSFYGYMCFEAATLGAARALGLEYRVARLDRANMFKEARGDNNVEFRMADITTYDIKEKFDYVLALNVLHHLDKQGQQVLDKLAACTKEKLIIETPKLPFVSLRIPGFKREVLLAGLAGPEAGARNIYIFTKEQ